MALSDTFSKLFKKDELRPFPGPESFMFGVATADHQCEACNPKCWDIRDWWEKDVTNVPRKHATDFWNRYKEDIELAANLGCNAFRFSIAWSQVQRKEEDKFDENAFKHYQSLIDTILAYDMKPVLTLHHFTWPIHVENRGGMIEKEFPEIFEKYVTAVAEHFAEYVPYWITFNEPNLLIGGYLNPWMNDKYAAPPGQLPGTPLHEQMEDVGNLISNLFLSHKRAYDVIKARNPRALVGVNQYCYGLPSWLQQFVNRNASAIKGDADLQRQVDRLSLHRDLIRGNRVSRMRGITFDKNKVDVVIAALTETSEREQEIRFSEAYFVTGHQLLVRSDSTIETRKDLDGKLIGFIKGSTSEKILFQLPLAQPKAFSDLKKALNALKKGSVDAIISDSAILLGLISRNAGQYKLLKEHLSKGECYAIGIPQGDNSLLEITDEVVRDFMKSQKAQQWKTSYEKQTGQKVEDLPPKKTRALVVNKATEIETRESTSQILKAPEGSVLRRIQDRDYLVVGVREGLQDLGVSDLEIDKFSWLEVELAQALAERILGDANKVQYRTLNVEKRISAMKNWPDLFNTILKHLTILSTLIMADWWYMGMKGNLDPYLCPPECKETLDFVGLDYYWGIPTVHPERIMRLIDAADRKFDLAPVWPNGLYDTLKNLHNQFPEKPIIIFENGSVKTADGLERADYLRRHIKQVQRAVQDDLNVKGYFCWSITSNREWDLTFDDASDFGLYRIELDKDPELKRNRTGCAGTYEEIIRSRRA